MLPPSGRPSRGTGASSSGCGHLWTTLRKARHSVTEVAALPCACGIDRCDCISYSRCMVRCCLVMLLVASSLPDFRAQESVPTQVDQLHLPNPAPDLTGWNIRLDLRQEFTPTLDRMDSLELFINLDGAPLSPTGGSLAIEIRQGGFDGTVIATSPEVQLGPFFQGSVLFRFSDPVSLVPGETYAFQPIPVSGNMNWFANANESPQTGYPSGRLYFDGSFMPDNTDLYFVEGINIPEPAPVMLIVLGFATSWLWFVIVLRPKDSLHAASAEGRTTACSAGSRRPNAKRAGR